MIAKQIKNEIFKLRKNKLLIAFCLFYIAFAGFSAYVYLDMESQGTIGPLTADQFLLSFSTDIINKPIIPIFIIIMNLIILESFIGDFERGTMKFELIAIPNRKPYYLGKILYGLLAYFIMSTIFLIIGLASAMIFFDQLSLDGLFRAIVLHYVNILPGMAIMSILIVFAGLSKNPGLSKILAIFLPILLTLLNNPFFGLSPIIKSDTIINIIENSSFTGLGMSLLIALVYFLVFSVLGIKSWENIEFS